MEPYLHPVLKKNYGQWAWHERPRMNPYVRTDGWDEEAAKWAERKAAQ
jgi:hypothetical protein